jgi:CheY-like chemotaxis protein
MFFKDERRQVRMAALVHHYYSDHIEMVLMGVTMHNMVGSDTSRATRRIPRFKSLPILSAMAKAMKGDRERCMKANAVELQRLFGRRGPQMKMDQKGRTRCPTVKLTRD